MLCHVERCEPGHVGRDFVDGEPDVVEVPLLLPTLVGIRLILLGDADHHVTLSGGGVASTGTAPSAAGAPTGRCPPAPSGGRRARDLDVELGIHCGRLDERGRAAGVVTGSATKHNDFEQHFNHHVGTH